MDCPCGTGRPFASCCQPYITGQALPEHAEQLMRSRYSAYVTTDIDYLAATTDPQCLRDFDADGARAWSEKATFTGLEIVAAEETGAKGVVEFKASYDLPEGPEVHHEVSTFRKTHGKWMFRSGRRPKVVEPAKP